MVKLVGLLTSMALIAAGQPLLLGQGLADTYEQALYPAGIGTRPDWEGKPQRPTFSLLDDATTARNVRAALVSERIPTGFYDDLFVIKFATFVGSPQTLKVAQVVDVTSSLTNYLEEPGNFYAVAGSVSPFRIDAKRSGLHVNAYSIISGSGAMTEASDLFFEVQDSGALTQVLALSPTTTRSKLNVANLTVEDSTIFVVDTNGDGTSEIVVQRRRDEIVNGKRMPPVTLPTQVYAFDGREYRPSAGPAPALANAKPLERAASAAVKIVGR
jgi:hypothetical protein